MSQKRKLHFNAFMRPATIHTGGWRYPGSYADANFNLNHIVHFAQRLEEGKFDTFFMADHLALLNMPIEALQRSATPTSFEPLTLLSALAMMTKDLGLIATASTTYDAPYHIARRFSSLDHISGGRAGWNIVTTSNPNASKNFGMDEQMEHDERYARAREFYDVVTGLWDSWADDAFIRDQESGIFMDPEKMHVLNHEGQYLKSRGPLNIARPIQAGRSSFRPAPPTPDDRLPPKSPTPSLPRSRPSITPANITAKSRSGRKRRDAIPTMSSSCLPAW